VGKAKPVLAGLAGAAALMVTVGPIIRALRQSSIDDIGRWRALTIHRPIEEISPGGQLPPALAALGSDIEVEIRSAPGDWGTEVAARWVGPKKSANGEDPGEVVRRALHEVKQLAEAGESAQRRPDANRTSSPPGRMVDREEKNADKGAVL
jgi:hypothetical protein